MPRSSADFTIGTLGVSTARIRSLLISLTLFLSRPVFADVEAPPRDQVDPDVAQGISIAVTAIGALGALGALALLVGPTGRWYAGERAVPTLLLRLTGTVVIVGALAASVDFEVTSVAARMRSARAIRIATTAIKPCSRSPSSAVQH